MIVEFDTALTTLIETAIPGVPVYGNFEPRADLTGAVIARLRFDGFGKQAHRRTESTIEMRWAIDLQADQALADATLAADMDGYLGTLLGALIGVDLTAGDLRSFDGIRIEDVGAGINEAESAMQFTLRFSFNAVIRRTS